MKKRLKNAIIILLAVSIILSMQAGISASASSYEDETTRRLLTWRVFEGTVSIPISATCQTLHREYYYRSYISGMYEYSFDDRIVTSYVVDWPYYSDLTIILHPEVDYYDSSGDYVESVELDYTDEGIIGDYDVYQSMSNNTDNIGVVQEGTGVTCESSTMWWVPDAYYPPSATYTTTCNVEVN